MLGASELGARGCTVAQSHTHQLLELHLIISSSCTTHHSACRYAAASPRALMAATAVLASLHGWGDVIDEVSAALGEEVDATASYVCTIIILSSYPYPIHMAG